MADRASLRRRGLVAVGAILAGVLLVGACSGSNAPSSTEAPDSSTTTTTLAADSPMRAFAGKDQLLVGTAVAVEPLRDEPAYRRTLAREYNAVTPENAMKWDTIHPAADRYDFAPADSIVRFARAHDMAVRGHTLVWHRQVPDWVTSRSWTRSELEAVLHDHIRKVVGHYRGKVAQWDVVNEAIDSDGTLRDSVWSRVIGPEYIELAFRWAHAADPNAKLFYNDYDLEFPGAKTDAVRALVRRLHDSGVPIDGVGVQAHAVTLRPPSPANLHATLQGFAGLGLDVAITEHDVGIFLPTTPATLADQAKIYGDVLSACLAVARCHTFMTWGFTDRYSWIPGELPGFGDALPFDASYQTKPAAATLRASLARGRT